MGVYGLWRLIEPSGTPVPLETLENKILAVDVSIWIHQAIKGFQDAKGQAVPNAHLLSLYHRICKLLYYKIKPVFVFDGGVPVLKKQIIAKRSQLRTQRINDANDIHKQLIKTLLKHSAVNKVLSENTKAKISTSGLSLKRKDDDDIYKLPPSNLQDTHSSDEEQEEEEDSFTTETDTDSYSPVKWDLHTIDEKSVHFKSLPIEVRHDILTELKETRKQSSWGRIHEMPRQSDGFSDYQMRRLLKRYSVQVSLEEIEKEMGGHAMSLGELESLLNDQGVISTNKGGHHIASDENMRYFLIKDVQKAIEKAKKVAEEKGITEESDEINSPKITINSIKEVDENSTNFASGSATRSNLQEKQVEDCKSTTESYDAELDRDLKRAIELSLQDLPSTSAATKPTLTPVTEEFSFNLEKFNDADFESTTSESDTEQNMLMTAKNYMVEYSGLSANEITNILQNELSREKKRPIDINKIETKKILTKPNLKSLITNPSISATKSIKVHQHIYIDDNTIKQTNSYEDTLQKRMEKSSESESDDFVEVEDSSLPNKVEATKIDVRNIKMDSTESKNSSGKHLEILINRNDNIDEDDIFADVFKQEDVRPSDTSEKSARNLQTSAIETEIIPKSVETVRPSTNMTETIVVSKPAEKIVPSQGNVEENKIKVGIKESLSKFMEEHARDVGLKPSASQITTDQLQLISDKLEMHKEELISERATKHRLAKNITDQMYQEVQELLELFGIPYIIAPMEAEAQCAFLNAIDLTDGTITDDSDIWLFGGKTVYKDFFNHNKHVKEFRADSIQRVYRLSREQMILLALLVGSDYTTGIQGIGPVTALEILAAFPYDEQQQLLSGLQEFREWLLDGKKVGPGKTALRSKLKNVEIVENFPSQQVMQAYLEPTIDSSKEPFSWGKPDMFELIEYANKKFGWKKTKSEEILKPILRRMKDSLSQKSIKDYFKMKHKIELKEPDTLMSKRVKKAVQKIGKEKRGAESDEELKVLKETKIRSKKKLKQIEKEAKESIDRSKLKKLNVKLSNNKTECIPQREKDNADLLRSKLKAIEVFRKSKQGPGFVQKHGKVTRKPKDDAELSESSTDS